MPCCAFAAFIISQIVIGFAAIRRFAFRTGDEAEILPNNPATEWRLIPSAAGVATGPGSPTSMTSPRWPRIGFRTLMLAASIEIMLVAAAAYGLHLHQHHHHVVANGSAAVRHVVSARDAIPNQIK